MNEMVILQLKQLIDYIGFVYTIMNISYMGMLVGQLIKILEQFDQDREVMIHTLSGETVEVRGYFVQKDIDDNSFYITDLDVVPR